MPLPCKSQSEKRALAVKDPHDERAFLLFLALSLTSLAVLTVLTAIGAAR